MQAFDVHAARGYPEEEHPAERNDDGYVATESGPRNAVLHRSIKPFREAVEPTGYETLAGTSTMTVT
jgi:hypothetical protein